MYLPIFTHIYLLAINRFMVIFTNDQLISLVNLRKNYYSLLLLHDSLGQSKRFWKFNTHPCFKLLIDGVKKASLKKNEKNDSKIDNDGKNINRSSIQREHTNPQQWELKTNKKIEEIDEEDESKQVDTINMSKQVDNTLNYIIENNENNESNENNDNNDNNENNDNNLNNNINKEEGDLLLQDSYDEDFINNCFGFMFNRSDKSKHILRYINI